MTATIALGGGHTKGTPGGGDDDKNGLPLLWLILGALGAILGVVLWVTGGV